MTGPSLLTGLVELAAFFRRLVTARLTTALADSHVDLDPGRRSGTLRWTADVGGPEIEVRLRALTGRHPQPGIAVDVVAPPLPTRVRFAAESMLTVVAEVAGRGDVVIGDRRFDHAVRVHADDPVHALQLLDTRGRKDVHAAVDAGAVFENGRWQAFVPASTRPRGPALARLARAMARAHHHVLTALETSPSSALESLVRNDRVAGVRHHAMTLLVRRKLATPDVLRIATGDLLPAIRLLAARELGPEGVETLTELLREGSRTWRFEAAEVLARGPLGADHAREVEDVLVGALGDVEQGARAAHLLSRFDTPSAAAALHRASQQGRHRAAAKRALAKLRRRVDPRLAGAVSLAAPEGGQVSVTDES